MRNSKNVFAVHWLLSNLLFMDFREKESLIWTIRVWPFSMLFLHHKRYWRFLSVGKLYFEAANISGVELGIIISSNNV